MKLKVRFLSLLLLVLFSTRISYANEPSVAELRAMGPAGLQTLMDRYRDEINRLVYEIVDLVADGDQVAFRWEAAGTQHGAFGPVPATGRTVRYRGATFCRVVDGLVVEVSSVNDLFGLLQQLGVEVSPPTT